MIRNIVSTSLWKLLNRIRPKKKSIGGRAPRIGWLQFEQLELRTLLAAVPVAHWAFDEGTGTVAADSSGYGHSATLGAGATWAAGNVGPHALKFNGSATGVATVTGPVVDTSHSFTVSAWVNLTTLSGYQTFVSIAGTNVAGFYLQVRGDTGTFAFSRLSSDATGTATYVAAPKAPVANTWYHVVGVDDTAAGTLSLYVDEQLIGTTSFTSNWAATGNTLIGHGFYGGNQVDYVNGSVDDVQIFASALSTAQVVAIDTPAAYPLDEGAGATSADSSGHGNTLTLGAAASWGAGHIGPYALAVNGTATANAVNAEPVLNTAQPFSVSAWVNMNSLAGTQTFASIDGGNVSGFALQYRADTGKFAFTRAASDSDAAAVYHADALAAPIAGTWYSLVGVNDPVNSQLLLYVNGVFQSSVSYSGGWQANGATVIGGGEFNGGRSDFANGLMDEVHFYNSPLTASAAANVGTNGGGIVTINAAATGATVAPNLFGAFMEDINYGGEGGIYSNEVRNSGFNDSSNPLNAWAAVAGAGVADVLATDATTGPTAALTMSAKLTITSGVSASAPAGISNSGYFGMAVAPSTAYTANFYAKASSGFTGPLTVSLESAGGTIYASATVSAISTAWTKYTVTLTTSAGAPTSSTNLFVISTSSPSADGATLWFAATYLYPPSYDNTSAHLRVDLMQKLVDLPPAVFRVPGGNFLEGNDYADRFNWQATIGPVEDRPGHMDPWGYWSTDDMGLDEYLQMAELSGAQTILAVYAGYTLNGTSDTGQTLTNDVTSAVNELHYVLDPVTTTWGAMRAANGHSAPYNVNYVEIGNEDFFSSTYSTRYPLFYNAIKAAFPNLQIIATSSSTGGSPFDVLDDHYYNPPSWFLANSTLFDNTTRGSYKIFVGEYASNDGYQTSTMNDALGDAAFLMGMERNSDLVVMSSYAPLWVNVNGQQWATDLIGLNNTTSFDSASYYAQQLLNLHHGVQVVGSSIVGTSLLQVLVTHTGNTYYLTVINPGPTALATAVNINGVSSVSSSGTAYTLQASYGTASNSIANPTLVAPATSTVTNLAASFTQQFPAYSLTILQITTNGVLPTVAVPAAANPAAVTGNTTGLSVLGTDAGGESSLTYTWSVAGVPPSTVAFSANGTNSAKNTVATFSKAGLYTLTATITNASGYSTASSVNVTVNQTLTGAAITPAATTLAPGSSTQLTAVGTDQFGNVMAAPLNNVTWSVFSGVGAVSASGLYSAPAGGSGVTTVRVVSSTGQPAYADVTLLSQVAWYPANASSGATLADASGNGKDATLVGASAFGSGVSGNALSLTGGYASLPTGIVSTLSDFTIAAWVKIDTLSAWSRIFDFGTGTTVNMFLTPLSGAGAVRFSITTSGSGAGEQQINGTSPLAAGVWQHVAVTLAGNTGTLYVNGVAIATNSNITLRPSSLGSTTQNYLGKSQYSADPALFGSIDDFRIVGRALSAAEIQQLVDPAVVTAASATSMTNTSTVLSALGADATGGEFNLRYSWSVIGTPPAPVTFSSNATNSAKTVTATFTMAGTYNFLVTMTNAAGFTATSSISVVVDPSYSSLSVSPASANLTGGASHKFTATALDQFGQPLSPQPAVTWTLVAGLGTLSANGLYAPPYASGSATLRAASGSFSATAAVTYTSQAQWNASSSSSWTASGNWKDAFAGASLAAPGVRGLTGDTVLFASATGPVARLDGANPTLAGITFDNAAIAYTIDQGSGGGLTLQGSNGATVSVLAGSPTINAPLHLASNTTFNAAAGATITITGPTDGGSGLTMTGGGTLVLDAANTFSGGLAVQSGTVVVSVAGGLPGGGSLTVGAAGAFNSPVVSGDFAAAAFVDRPTAASIATSSASRTLSPFAVAAVMARRPVGPRVPPWIN
jgi:autotransporter-associated beta strand protein